MKLFWKMYACLFFVIVLSNALQLFNKDSLFGVYYNTTIVFNKWYIVPYVLNILNALIGCVVFLFILGYALDLDYLTRAPQCLFYLRLLSDSTGHSYELKMAQSAFYQGKLLGLITLASLILPILPSYMALWRMTFIPSQTKTLK